MSLRFTLDEWVMGEGAPPSARRSLLETGGIMAASLATALLFPTASEKIFSITGATGVLVVCYVVPVLVHLLLLGGGSSEGAPEQAQAPLLGAAGEQAGSRFRRPRWGWAAWLGEVAVPCGVLVLGVGCSLAALWVALARLLSRRP